MNKIFKEPLLYFLLLGGAMFMLFQQVSDEGFSSGDQLEEIVVTEGQVNALILNFEKVWQRLPTQQELDGLVQDYIKEEIFYREALAMGLDQGDTIIRRRLRQKIEFLTEDIARLDVPTDEELQLFLDMNQASYLGQSLYSFQQIYFDVSRRGSSALTDAHALLLVLQEAGEDSDIDLATVGDRLMMTEANHDRIRARDVQRVLGNQFLAVLETLPTSSWQGPVESGFGLHLVYLSERIDGSVPPLDEVRDAVLRDWTLLKQKEVNEDFYTSLKQRYHVSIEDFGEQEAL